MHEFDTFTRSFRGKPLTTLVWGERLAWVASHVGTVLGYAGHGRRLVHHVLGDWNAQFAEGHDYLFLTGSALAALQGIGTEGPVVTSPHAPSGLLLLLEPGLQLVLEKTDPEVATDLQRFLDEDVLPRMTGETSAPANAPGVREDSQIWTMPSGVLSLVVGPTRAERQEARVHLQAQTKASWVALCERRFRVDALHRLLDTLGSTLHDAAKVAIELTAAEIATGINLASLLDDPDDDDPSDGQVLELDRAA